MPDFIYGVSAYERREGDLPNLPVINMVVEKSPTENKPVLQSRPGIDTSDITMGLLGVKRLFQVDGILENRLFGVGGTNLYANSSNLGAINGTGPVTFGGYEELVFVTAGQDIWSYDGTSLTLLDFPDEASVSSICVASSRLLAIRDDTGRFYWSDVLGSDIEALAFATAETSPDKLKELLFIGDTLILFGSETVEFWVASDDPDLPFQPTIGRVYPVGIRGTGSATTFSGGFAWITDNNQICFNEPSAILSDLDLQTKIEDSTSALLWTFRLDGDEYLAVRLDTSTHVFGSRSQTWSEMQSFGRSNWLPQCYEAGYFGASNNGTLLQWTDDYSDFGSFLERRFRAWVPINSGGFFVSNITLRTNPGRTVFLTGDYLNPIIEMTISRDGGETWGRWKSRYLGIQGKYRKQTKWNSLGIHSYPGMMVEFRITDPVPFRVSEVLMNEVYGGT